MPSGTNTCAGAAAGRREVGSQRATPESSRAPGSRGSAAAWACGRHAPPLPGRPWGLLLPACAPGWSGHCSTSHLVDHHSSKNPIGRHSLTMFAMQCSKPMAMKADSGLRQAAGRRKRCRGLEGAAGVPASTHMGPGGACPAPAGLPCAARSCPAGPPMHAGRPAHPRMEMNLPPAVCARVQAEVAQRRRCASSIASGTARSCCHRPALLGQQAYTPHAHLGGSCLPHSQADEPVGQHCFDLRP